MDETDWLNYFSAVGQEFSWALDPDGHNDLVPMDAADAVFSHLGQAGATPTALANLTAAGRAKLAWHLAVQTEIVVAPEQVDEAIARLLARWPAGQS